MSALTGGREVGAGRAGGHRTSFGMRGPGSGREGDGPSVIPAAREPVNGWLSVGGALLALVGLVVLAVAATAGRGLREAGAAGAGLLPGPRGERS